MVLPLGAGLPGPMLNKFGTGEGAGSFPVKLNDLFTSAVPVLVVNAAGVPLFPLKVELLLLFAPKLGVPILALKACPPEPKVDGGLVAPKAGVELLTPKDGAAIFAP